MAEAATRAGAEEVLEARGTCIRSGEPWDYCGGNECVWHTVGAWEVVDVGGHSHQV